jgi:hypothetical protein
MFNTKTSDSENSHIHSVNIANTTSAIAGSNVTYNNLQP